MTPWSFTISTAPKGKTPKRYDLEYISFEFDAARRALTESKHLFSAFVWALTPEGHDFWEEQHASMSDAGRSALIAMINQSVFDGGGQ